jgi:hypothetical protein
VARVVDGKQHRRRAVLVQALPKRESVGGAAESRERVHVHAFGVDPLPEKPELCRKLVRGDDFCYLVDGAQVGGRLQPR